jgi:hypothetical protein
MEKDNQNKLDSQDEDNGSDNDYHLTKQQSFEINTISHQPNSVVPIKSEPEAELIWTIDVPRGSKKLAIANDALQQFIAKNNYVTTYTRAKSNTKKHEIAMDLLAQIMKRGYVEVYKENEIEERERLDYHTVTTNKDLLARFKRILSNSSYHSKVVQANAEVEDIALKNNTEPILVKSIKSWKKAKIEFSPENVLLGMKVNNLDMPTLPPPLPLSDNYTHNEHMTAFLDLNAPNNVVFSEELNEWSQPLYQTADDKQYDAIDTGMHPGEDNNEKNELSNTKMTVTENQVVLEPSTTGEVAKVDKKDTEIDVTTLSESIEKERGPDNQPTQNIEYQAVDKSINKVKDSDMKTMGKNITLSNMQVIGVDQEYFPIEFFDMLSNEYETCFKVPPNGWFTKSFKGNLERTRSTFFRDINSKDFSFKPPVSKMVRHTMVKESSVKKLEGISIVTEGNFVCDDIIDMYMIISER